MQCVCGEAAGSEHRCLRLKNDQLAAVYIVAQRTRYGVAVFKKIGNDDVVENGNVFHLFHAVHQRTAHAAARYVPVGRRIERKAFADLLSPLLDFIDDAGTVIDKLLYQILVAEIEAVIHDGAEKRFLGKAGIGAGNMIVIVCALTVHSVRAADHNGIAAVAGLALGNEDN